MPELKQTTCRCGERFLFDEREPQPELCLICDPPEGMKIRRCYWCHHAFAQETDENYRVLQGHLRMAARDARALRRMAVAEARTTGSCGGLRPRNRRGSVDLHQLRAHIHPELRTWIAWPLPRSPALLRLQPEQIGLMDLTVTLTDAQLEAIAPRVAELLADRRASEPVPELLPVAPAAQLAGVSAKTIRNWLSTGKLPRTGSRIARTDLMALLAGPQRSMPRRARRRAQLVAHCSAEPAKTSLAGWLRTRWERDAHRWARSTGYSARPCSTDGSCRSSAGCACVILGPRGCATGRATSARPDVPIRRPMPPCGSCQSEHLAPECGVVGRSDFVVSCLVGRLGIWC